MNKDDFSNQKLNALGSKEPHSNILPLFPEKPARSIQDSLKNLNIDLEKIFKDKPLKRCRYPSVVLPFKKDK